MHFSVAWQQFEHAANRIQIWLRASKGMKFTANSTQAQKDIAIQVCAHDSAPFFASKHADLGKCEGKASSAVKLESRRRMFGRLPPRCACFTEAFRSSQKRQEGGPGKLTAKTAF